MRLELEGKKKWSEPVIMESLSSRYGWTPEQIRSMRVEDIHQYLEIIAEINKIEKIKAMRNKR